MYGRWNARFLLQLRIIHFKSSLRKTSRSDEEEVHLIGTHCPIHPLKFNKIHVPEYLLHSSLVIQEFHLSGY